MAMIMKMVTGDIHPLSEVGGAGRSTRQKSGKMYEDSWAERKAD